MSELVAAPKLPPVIAGRYVPIRVIGRGGMGIVYEVEHARTGERLALKALPSTVDPSPEAVERFKLEARTLARIKSENVVRVTDADVASELDGAPFLVMELLEGTDVERAAKASPPTPATVVEWLRQAARAIDKAHRLGIVHRDLKPENLFLTTVEDRPPIIKVLDFGIAKMAEGTGVTSSGQVLGTPRYMAPEQAAATPHVTAATDLYALGMVAYRLIMGESYYRDEQLMGILGQLLHGQLRLPSERNPSFGERFDAWFSKACHREQESRFPSAAVQIEALAEALGLPTVPIESPRDQRITPGGSPPVDMTPTRLLGAGTPRSGSAPPGRRFPWRLVVLAVGAVVAATIAAVFVFRGSRPPPPPPASVPAPAPAPTPAIPSSEAAPAPTTTGSGKPRPLRPRRTAGPPKSPKLPAADPFADQK